MYTLTKRRSEPVSSQSRSRIPGYVLSRCTTSSCNVTPSPATVSRSPVRPRRGVGIFTLTAIDRALPSVFRTRQLTFDYVAGDGVDADAFRFSPAEATLNLVSLPVDFEDYP